MNGFLVVWRKGVQNGDEKEFAKKDIVYDKLKDLKFVFVFLFLL